MQINIINSTTSFKKIATKQIISQVEKEAKNIIKPTNKIPQAELNRATEALLEDMNGVVLSKISVAGEDKLKKMLSNKAVEGYKVTSQKLAEQKNARLNK